MPRCLLIAELATNHGGDLSLAKSMIDAAVQYGADIVKTQGYQIRHLSKLDQQYAWFQQAELSDDAHKMLKDYAEDQGVRYLSTGYTVSDLYRLSRLGLDAVKIGSGEGLSLWPAARLLFRTAYLSLPWGMEAEGAESPESTAHCTCHVMAAVPLYPAPAEAWSRVEQRAGYSDHHVGMTVAHIAIANGASILEKHFHLPGRGRNQAWNMDPDDLATLRQWADAVHQATAGTAYEGRWKDAGGTNDRQRPSERDV